MAVYPGDIKSFSRRRDFTDTIVAKHMNELQDEVRAIQETLGVNPACGAGPDQIVRNYPTVKDRLQQGVGGNAIVVETYAQAPYATDDDLLGAITWHVTRTTTANQSVDTVGGLNMSLPGGRGTWLVTVQGSGPAPASGTAYIDFYTVRDEVRYRMEYYTEYVTKTGYATGRRQKICWDRPPERQVRCMTYKEARDHSESYRCGPIRVRDNCYGESYERDCYRVEYEDYTYCYEYTVPVTKCRKVPYYETVADIVVTLQRDCVAGQAVGIVGHYLPYKQQDGCPLYMRVRGVETPRIHITALKVSAD